MKVYFDDSGTLTVEATDNIEMVALVSWGKSEKQTLIKAGEHLKAKNVCSSKGLPSDFRFGKDGSGR
tara:strand:+ start:415 stop:615 length:201 start_codon:yes stop_codon:yes gene_type:complete